MTWELWTPSVAARRADLLRAVEAFEPVDVPEGHAAARWLKEEALANDGSTKTRLLVEDERVTGFIALCAGQVVLTRSAVEDLGLPSARTTLPAVILAWVGRHREAAGEGFRLVATAFGLTRRTAHDVGVVAFALDPMTAAAADLWRAEPYGFRPSAQTSRGRPPRLWLPVDLED